VGRRLVRLLAAAVVVTGLATAVGPGNGGLPVAGAAAPAAPGPASPGCAPGDGVVITSAMAAAVAVSDGHAAVTPAGASVSAECGPQHDEADLGWPGSAPDTPMDAAEDESDDSDPFAPSGDGQLYYYAYQFDDYDGTGLPDYWEPSTALRVADWPATGSQVRYVWRDPGTGTSRTASLPVSAACGYRGPVPASRAPGQVASYRHHGHPKIYLYDHVPLARAARRFQTAGGDWYHYLCGAATPSGIAGPGSRLTATEADYYSTPHWVYARGWTGAELDLLASVWRVARSQTEVYDAVRTSPAARSVVALPVWMWAPSAGYDVELGNLRARVEPTGIVVRAPGVPLHAHDLRDGGCRGGGRPDTGDPAAKTDCYLVFDRATGADPAASYPVGFALRWTITTRTAGGLPVGRPMTFWTTSVRQFQVGEVQVVGAAPVR
jgi:hypothetical protein